MISISKWESKWEIPFLHSEKTEEQLRDYVRLMTLTQNVDPNIYYCLSNENLLAIKEYIDKKMTATTINDDGKKAGRQIITAEIIYYWMIALNIPFECQKWHINKLLTLIRVCNIKNQPPKKMRPGDWKNKKRALNEARRKKHNTRG